MRGERRRSGGGALRFLVPLLALWVIPVGLGLVLVPAAQHAETAVSVAGPRMVTVGERSDAHRVAVTAAVTTRPARAVVSPRGGLVTAVFAAPDSDVTNGTMILAVDGVTLVALTGDAPVYRDIGPKVHGPDVAAAATLLADMGLLSKDALTDTYSTALASAICAFQKRVGSTCDRVFHPDAVVYVPSGSSHVTSVDVAVGDRIAEGADVLGAGATVASLTFNQTANGASPSALSDAELDLTGADGSDLHLTSIELAGEELSKAATFIMAHGSPGAQETDGSGQAVQTFNGLMLALATPETVGAIPATAAYVSASGSLCVFVADGTTFHALAEPALQPLAGEVGVLAASKDLVGTSIVRDPSLLPAEVLSTCD